MNRYQRRALESLRFDWAHTPEDVWRGSDYHVDGLHDEVLASIAAGIRDAAGSTGPSPVGVAVLGQHGAGKTHLLGVVREQVRASGGYFFLVELLDSAAFWERLAQATVDGLLRAPEPGERQLATFLRRLCQRSGALTGVWPAIVGERTLSRRELASFIGGLRRLDGRVGLECQDIARALVLLAAPDFDLQDLGYQFLLSMEETTAGERISWGIRQPAPPPDLVVRDVSRLLALTGPSVVAIDQIDPLVAVATKLPAETGRTYEDGRDAVLLDQLAAGLMSLRDRSRRSLTVVACLPESWILVKERTVNTVADRFREAVQLHRIPSAEVGRAIIEKRFSARFQAVGFTPPYPTWPVREPAFADAIDFTPRGLLRRVGAHVQRCLRAGEATELDRLAEPADVPAAAAVPAPPADPGAGTGGADLAALDARYAQLRAAARPEAALDPNREDELMPELLAAGLTAWIAERGDDEKRYQLDPPPSRKPALHARLRRSLDEATEDERHWAFRAIASGSARAVQARVRHACTMAALRQGTARRRLFLLRNAAWPAGPVTREVVAEFTAAGGEVLPVSADDLRSLAALRQLLAEPDGDLREWLMTRRPASGTALLQAALAGEAGPEATGQPSQPASQPESSSGPEPAREPAPPTPPAPAVRLDPAGRPVPAVPLGVGGGDRAPGLGRAGGAPQARGDLRRLRLGQDRADPAAGRGVRPARRLRDHARPQQRPGPAGRPVAGAAARVGTGRRRTGRRLPGAHRRGGVDPAAGGRPAAQPAAAAGLRQRPR
jgi:hypothetical protein